MSVESLYYGTYRDGAFDAPDDDVFNVADRIGLEFPQLREDVLDRYASHQAMKVFSSGMAAQDQAVTDDAERVFTGMAKTLNIPRSDVDSAVLGAFDGRPFALDQMMADYFGR